MAGFVGATSGLLIFAAMLIRGALVGNPVDVVLSRSLVGLVAGVALGSVAGWLAETVIVESIDESGSRSQLEAANPAPSRDAESPVQTGAPT